jgi:hypothetical protein
VLMRNLIEYCRDTGIGELTGDIMAVNRPMLDLARSLGFELVPGADAGIVRARMRPAAAPSSSAGPA